MNRLVFYVVILTISHCLNLIFKKINGIRGASSVLESAKIHSTSLHDVCQKQSRQLWLGKL
jgi:hypothetical protein